MELLKSNKPLVSIGIPVYNGERYIRRSLDSLLAQDYANVELIVSDNASTDDTPNICRGYAKKDKRVTVYSRSCTVSASENFKTVLEIARGSYFMWAADDDYWLPTFVTELVEELENHPEVGIAMCAVNRIREDSSLFDTVHFLGNDNPNKKNYYQMARGLCSSKKYNLYIYGLFRTQLLKRAIAFFLEVPGSDRLFICHMSLATKFRYVNKVLHIRMVHNKSMGMHPPLVEAQTLFALARIIYSSNIIPWYRKCYLPIVLWHYGWLLLKGRFIKKLYTIAPKIKKRVSLSMWDRLKKMMK